jgi:hypothetical protein
VGALKFFEFLMLKYVLAIHLVLEVNDVGLGHYFPRILSECLNSIVLHVSMKLAFSSKLVDSINMVIDLMRKQLLHDLKSTNLSVNDVREHHTKLLWLFVV